MSQEAYEHIDLRRRLMGGTVSEDDEFADAFAAALLMPEAAFRKLFLRLRRHKGTRLIEMSVVFGVPVECVVYRCDQLGLTP